MPAVVPSKALILFTYNSQFPKILRSIWEGSNESLRERPESRPPAGICPQGKDTDLLLRVDGEKQGVSKARKVSTEGSDTPVSYSRGVSSGAYSPTLTVEMLNV